MGMRSYYTMLLRAIGEPGMATAEFRRAVYEKAQAALITELAKARPMPSPADIDRQYQSLTSAIRRIEAETANANGEMSAVRLSISREIVLSALARAEAKSDIKTDVHDPARIDPRLIELLPS
ncbi:MAG: hypothetical protein ACXWJW_06200 [Xanthobacteraceae bacterium]